MPLTKLQFEPGLNRETTGYANQGGWWDSNKVRFRSGYAEKIGGWQNAAQGNYYLGICRGIHPWTALDGNEYIGWGTSQKYYIFYAGDFYDITPIRLTTAAGEVKFAAGRNQLNGDISATATSLTLSSVTGFPTSGGLIRINTSPNFEDIRYSAISGNNLIGLQRGQNGTSARSHVSGTAVFCATLIVTDASHGADKNDFVTFSGASGLGGNITEAVLEQEYQITNVIDSTKYTVEARTVSSIASITTSSGLNPTYVFPNASDTGDGGSLVIGAYQINSGLDEAVSGNGWGAGVWGGIGTGGMSSPPTTTGWGDPATTTVTGGTLRLWGHDNFGENLIFNVYGGGIYYWQKDTSFPRAVALSSLSGASDTPTLGNQVMVSDNDRHVVLFGSNGTYNPSSGAYVLGNLDPLLVRFSNVSSNSNNPADFNEASATTSAGSIRLGTGSYIVTAVETKQEIVIFTDVSLHSFKYVGPPNTFGLFMLSDNISISSTNAAVSVDDTIFWMGNGEFYIYSGVVQTLPCDVKDYIFSNINQAQLEKVFCGANINYSEVWWFYPSNTMVNGVMNTENDSYVVYNYQQKIWYIGTMARTAWTHKNAGINPIAASTDHAAYLHEYGSDDGSTNPPSAINAYIESSGQEIGDGDKFVSIWRIIPDITFRDSIGTPYVTISISSSNFPGGAIMQNSYPLEGTGNNLVRSATYTASYPPEQFYSVANGTARDAMYVRIRGRSFTFRIESNTLGTAWRLGLMRLDIKLDGKR
jgi:hypothetical protein